MSKPAQAAKENTGVRRCLPTRGERAAVVGEQLPHMRQPLAHIEFWSSWA